MIALPQITLRMLLDQLVVAHGNAEIEKIMVVAQHRAAGKVVGVPAIFPAVNRILLRGKRLLSGKLAQTVERAVDRGRRVRHQRHRFQRRKAHSGQKHRQSPESCFLHHRTPCSIVNR
ncbi:hypothetical protein SDC9_152038 [bioreactor metagenome]|uniref:Uncharacterized protein n=1 Tax=bioreactor metagenome TaxID=1076179 RepID=A0A645ETN9_9ZZZZ